MVYCIMQIVIVNSEDEKESFIDEIGDTILPKIYGGKVELTLIQDVKLESYEATHP